MVYRFLRLGMLVLILAVPVRAEGDDDDDEDDFPRAPGGMNWEGDPFPSGYGHNDLKSDYTRSVVPDPEIELFPRKDEGGIRTRFRLGRDMFVTVGPNGTFDRETALLRVLEEDWDADHRIAAIEDLTIHHKNIRTARTITRRLSDVNLRVREAAADALGQLGYRGAIVPLIMILRQSINDSLKATIGFSLSKITGRDFGTEAEAWAVWHEGARKTLYQQGTLLPLKAEEGFPPAKPGDPIIDPVEAEIDEDDDSDLP